MLEIEKPLDCEFCSATFNSQETLNIHNRLHVQQSVMCIVCRAVFSTLGSMRVHLWKAHSISKSDQERNMVALNWAAESFAPEKSKVMPPYKCYRCNKSFKYEFSIARHLRTHRRKESGTTSSIPSSSTGGMLQPKTTTKCMMETNSDNYPLVHDQRILMPTNPGTNETTTTLSLSVEDEGLAIQSYLSTKVPQNVRSYRNSKECVGATNRRHRPSLMKHECGWCGASFKFDFSYEAHTRQHVMMMDCKRAT